MGSHHATAANLPLPSPGVRRHRVLPVSRSAVSAVSAPSVGAKPDRVTGSCPTPVIALQRAVGNAAVGRLVSAARPIRRRAAIQRLGELEHKSLGDTATGGAIVNVGGEQGDARFELSYGDVVMLSGDYFEPHQLMDFAAKPGQNGTRLGTRDEVIYAIKKGTTSGGKVTDARFQGTSPWAGWKFSPDVIKAVDDRFNDLASKNADHYGAPRGRDASGAPRPTKKGESSAGGTYRNLHEEALWLAYEAGAGVGTSQSHAMAMEAAAGHFLTDAFASGHVQTPIGSMRDYWGGKYPLFFYNLLHKIALDTAAEINSQDTNTATIVGSVQTIYDKILSQVMTMAKSLPPISLGDLIAKVFHDWDNKHGVAVQGGVLLGDGSLDKPTKPGDPPNVTRPRAEAAIKAGVKEIDAAFALGGSQAGLAKPALHQQIQATATAAGAAPGVYAAEALLPIPDKSVPAQNWMAASIEDLWNLPIVQGAKITVGDQIAAAMGPGGSFREQVEDLAKQFPPSQPVHKGGVYVGTVRPQMAYTNGFAKPLFAKPKDGVLSIIHWVPSRGLGNKDRDDVALETGQELLAGKQPGQNLKGMTTPARIGYVRELTGGSVADDEAEMVVQIFATAAPAERPKIYQGVEGHPWSGDWFHGFTKADDEIWNALDKGRLKRLRKLINEGKP